MLALSLWFIIKGILCTLMEAFCTYNLRLPGIIEWVAEIPGEVIQQNRGQKNSSLSLSFSLVCAKNTRAYGSIFQHLNILGSLEDGKKEETCAVEPEIDCRTVLPDMQSASRKAISKVSVLLCLKVFQWSLMGLKEMESTAIENEESYKHFYKLVIVSRGITHIALGYPLFGYVPSRFSLWLVGVTPLLEIIKMHIVITRFSNIHTQQVQDTYM